jgi:peroxiredoxin
LRFKFTKMDSVTLKGHPVMILEEFPAVGTKAEDVYYVKSNLDEESLYDIDSKVKVVLAVPS